MDEKTLQSEVIELEEGKEDLATIDVFDEDPLEDLGIEFLLEEVENKIAPLALAY